MRIALIGYGEVGKILAEDLRAIDHVVTAFDLELASEAGESMKKHARSYGVTLGESHADAVRQAELVVSVVTASETVEAARASAGALRPDAFFLDFNSAAPRSKIAAAAHVIGGGGRYVEGAVMAPVPPHRLRVPLLLGGPDAARLAPVLDRLGFTARVASAELGVASAAKMCRSIVIKGLEAMLIESLTTARHYGVEDAVLASWHQTFPSIDWAKQAAYAFQRVIEHGDRRSEEMREVTVTVHDAGLEPWAAVGTAESQAWMADLADQDVFGVKGSEGFARSDDFRTEADRLLAHLKSARQ